MHARELIDMAAVIADLGPSLLATSEVASPRGPAPTPPGRPISMSGMEAYWSASKCRLDRWSRSLRAYADWMLESGNSPFTAPVRSAPNQSAHAPPEHLPSLWQSVRPVLEEILTSEMLTRIWAAVACGMDYRGKSTELAPIARNVLTGHLEARNRALNLMVYGQGFGVEEAVAMNRLRRRTERWTDMLLGNLQPHCPVDECAFDPQRVAEFSRDLQRQVNSEGGTKMRAISWQVLTASLQAAFRKGLSESRPNSDLNQQIVAGILETLPPELFDTQGLPKPLWLMRLYRTADETEGMIEQLLDEATALPDSDAPGAYRRFDGFSRH